MQTFKNFFTIYLNFRSFRSDYILVYRITQYSQLNFNAFLLFFYYYIYVVDKLSELEFESDETSSVTVLPRTTFYPQGKKCFFKYSKNILKSILKVF